MAARYRVPGEEFFPQPPGTRYLAAILLLREKLAPPYYIDVRARKRGARADVPALKLNHFLLF
jgi:hypothetical protein